MVERAVAAARLLAESVGWEVGHQRTVARYAVKLFDPMRDLHVLGDDARLLLEVAAHVHDIGFAYGQAKHHKTSEQMITLAGIKGLDQRSLAMAAAIARYHRKALPTPKHEAYSALRQSDKRTVRWCAALLRVADGFDRAHDDAISGFSVTVTKSKLTIEARCRGDCETDLWGARRKTDLLEAESGRSVGIVGTRARVPRRSSAP